MRVIIVGRDQAIIAPLTARLKSNFQVSVADNSAAVQAYLKKGGVQFLIAEPSLLLDHNLGREVVKRCPMARLIALASKPTLLGMADALSSGITDYFPRSEESFGELEQSLLAERRRMIRWKQAFLSDEGGFTPEVSPDQAGHFSGGGKEAEGDFSEEF